MSEPIWLPDARPSNADWTKGEESDVLEDIERAVEEEGDATPRTPGDLREEAEN